ncbi:MAG: hypothetical protein WC399_04290 [Bacilli bacterium]|jgi:hypothetical protein
MERKKVFASLLTGAIAIGATLVFGSQSQNRFIGNVKAEPTISTCLFNHQSNPGADAPSYGFIDIENVKAYYLTDSMQENDANFLRLSALDASTPGLLANVTAINGILSLTVHFTGGPLYAIESSTFFEDYLPDPVNDLLTSGTPRSFDSPTTSGYFLLMTESTEDVIIQDVSIAYQCGHEVDDDYYYESDWSGDGMFNHYVGARSWGNLMGKEPAHDMLQFMTNPTETTNNYAPGTTPPNTNPDQWYRWNGTSIRNYVLDGETKDYSNTPMGEFSSNNFEVTIAVIVDADIFFDAEAWFHVCPWVGLKAADHSALPDVGEGIGYMQSYIGTDNFDPIGGIKARTDTYRGRFYTNYTANVGAYDWGFANPDTTYLVGSETMTLRQAYQATDLPIFNVRFVVDDNDYDLYINGFHVYHEDEAFYLEENYLGQEYSLETIEFHGVNYGDGIDSDGEGPDTIATPLPGYMVTYTNPIIREILPE